MANLPTKLNDKIGKQYLSKIDNYFFDCDGVLYRGGTVIKGVPEVLNKLERQKKKIFYITNNSSKSRDQVSKKLIGMGYPVHIDNIISSAYVAAHYVAEKNYGTVFVLGDQGLEDEIRSKGVKVVSTQKNFKANSTMERLQEYKKDDRVSAVVVGLTEDFSYLKGYQAMSYLHQTRIPFIATNLDTTYPGANGKVFPGGGSVVAMVAVASGREPEVNCGKPEHVMADVIKKTCNVDFSKSLMVGDRLDTDIKFGLNNGMQTLLVLSGVTSMETVAEFSMPSSQPKIFPHHFVYSFADVEGFV